MFEVFEINLFYTRRVIFTWIPENPTDTKNGQPKPEKCILKKAER